MGEQAQRFRPRPGRQLTMSNVKGPWRPSGAVGGCGFFAVVWTTGQSAFWAPLHDFDAETQMRFLEECRRLDRATDYQSPPNRTAL